MKLLRGLVLAALLVAPLPAAAYSIIHSHVLPEGHPAAPLVSDTAGTLYGTAADQGTYVAGAVFALKADGTGYTVLHAFAGGAADGAIPYGGLVLDGSGYLYGTTFRGGASNLGTVFAIKTDGTGFTLLHSFSGGASDGKSAYASLVLDGSGNLYGTTFEGGGSDCGTVFTVKVDGAGFAVLHSFSGGGSEGRSPYAGVVLDGSDKLYGTTYWGGDQDGGTVFSMRTDGTGFLLLHPFASSGYNPRRPVTLDGAGNLYGTTEHGGASGSGAVFKMKMDGTEFTILHTLAGSEGQHPHGGLVLDGSGTLYGTTYEGGASDGGTLFKVKTDGTGFTVLHTFTGGSSDGSRPFSGLILSGSGYLYGTTYFGGPTTASAGGLGTVFKLRTDGTGFSVVHAFFGGGSDSQYPMTALVLDASGNLYGTTTRGGGVGQMNSGTAFKLRTDGTGFTQLHGFTGPPSGRYPNGLILDGSGVLYDTSAADGESQWSEGTVFKMRTDGTGITMLHSFSDASGGLLPEAGLVLDGSGNLYGSTSGGGASNHGTIFTLKTDGTGFTQLHSFDGAPTDGAGPLGLIFDGSERLYGVTARGGATDGGTILALNADGTGLTLLHEFAGGAADGRYPLDRLVLDGSGTLYGTTVYGGASDGGTIFKVKTDGTGFGLLHDFPGGASDGRNPCAGLILDDSGNLYGTTSAGGGSDRGTVFTIKTDGTDFTVLHEFLFGALDGTSPRGALTLDAAGNLYGTTAEGGSADLGTEFTLASLTSAPVVTAAVAAGGTICSGQSIQISAQLTGIGPWNLAWSDGVTQMAVPSSPVTRTVSPDVTTAYSVIAIWNASGVGASSGVAIVTVNPTPAAPSAASNSPICAGGTINLSATSPASGVTYSWSGPGFNSSSQNPSITNATAAMSGNYTVIVTTPDGCTSPAGTVDVLVTLRPAVTPPAPITIDQTTCCGLSGGATPAGSAALAAFLAAGSAVDGCDPSPARLPAQVGGADVTSATCFAAGTTPVTFRFENADGRAGTATSDVTVWMFGDLNADAAIDPSDFVVLRAYFNFVVAPGTQPFTAPLRMADLTHDATVDPSDMVVLRAYFNLVVGCLAP